MENEFKPNILVISGGGPKGIAFVGALTELENKTTFDSSKIKILSGSSIGGIICFALCVGYTLLEMKNWFLSIDFSILCPALYNENYSQKILPLLSSHYSLSTGDEINQVIINIFIYKNIYTDITFGELYKKTGKLLVVTGSNLTLKRCDYFSNNTTPSMKILDALLITTRIPYIFPYIKYNDCIYVDGHLFDPFPVKGCNVKKEDRNKIIGIRTLSRSSIQIENIRDFTISIIDGISNQYIRKLINKYKKNIIDIEVDTEFFNLKINTTEMNDLFNKGIQAGLSYLEERNFIKSSDVLPPV